MNVIVILGSPRKTGSSAAIAGRISGDLEGHGAAVSTVFLNDLVYQGCQACRACKTTSETCVLDDDLTPVFDRLVGADVVILATPVYWGDISAQMKGFIDRLYGFLTPDFMQRPVKHRLPPGKQLVFITTQAADPGRHADIFPRYNTFFETLRMFQRSYSIRGCGLDQTARSPLPPELVDAARRTASCIVADLQR